MVDATSVRDLVDKLESTLHTTERDFEKSLQVGEGTTDQELDELFLREDFDRCLALKELSVTNLCHSLNNTNTGRTRTPAAVQQ